MARKQTVISEVKLPIELLISHDEAKIKIQERITTGQELKDIFIANSGELKEIKQKYKKWDEYNADMLKMAIFTTDEESIKYSRSSGLQFTMANFYGNNNSEVSDFRHNIGEKIRRLESVLERLELIPLAKNISTEKIQMLVKQDLNNKVFIVHGRDEAVKLQLEVLLLRMGLEPIVLHRQADEGLTIIEKFLKHSDVGYAFILLTPDEIAYLSEDDNLLDSERNKEKRARPNVIFEFGFFVGKLGREKICCLCTGDVNLPSDISGVVYKKFSSSVDEVVESIRTDLKAAGYGIK